MTEIRTVKVAEIDVRCSRVGDVVTRVVRVFSGPQGPAGMIWRGVWSADSKYVALDGVAHEGTSYICTGPIGPTPISPKDDPSHWDVLSEKGDKGDPGIAATIEVDPTSGEVPYGTPTSITNTGTTSAAIFKILIQRARDGIDGKSLEYDWNGTSLGIRVEGDPDFVYVNLIGNTGPQGVVWKGPWSSGTTYGIGDGISYNGSSYIAIATSTGQLPTNATYWALLAQRGTDGVGTGDVNGPANAVANHMALFDGTTGKLIKDGGQVPTLDSLGGQPAGNYASATQGALADNSVQQGDPRLTNARTPTAHAASHATGGTDPVTPTAIGAVKNQGSANGLLVLAAAAPIPGGTPAGTVIVRTP